MHTVALTSAFIRAAHAAGLTDDDIDRIIDLVADNPMLGDEVPGTGGCRKFRVAGRGKGKSGGYRTISFYSGPSMPVFLITAFSKGERANLSKAECHQLKALTKAIVDGYRVAPQSKSKGLRK
jgi:hypothetical protein